MKWYSFLQLGKGIKLFCIMIMTLTLMACGGGDDNTAEGDWDDGDGWSNEDWDDDESVSDDWSVDGFNDLANSKWSSSCGSTPDGGSTNIVWSFDKNTYTLYSATYIDPSCNQGAMGPVRKIHSESGTYRVGPNITSDEGLSAKKINFTVTELLGDKVSDPLTRLDIYYVQDKTTLYVGQDYGVAGWSPRGTALDFDGGYARHALTIPPNDGGLDGEQSEPSIFEGRWVKKCSKYALPSELPYHSASEVVFTGNKFTKSIKKYDSLECDTLIEESPNPVVSGTFVLSEEIMLATGQKAFEIDFMVDSANEDASVAPIFDIVSYGHRDGQIFFGPGLDADKSSAELRPTLRDYIRGYVKQ